MKHVQQILTAVVAGLLLVTSVWAQTPQETMTHKHSATQQQPMAGGNMMEECKAMMEAHQKMHAEMKAMDSELDKLVAEMNAAPADKKADATAAVVTKIVAQRGMMREKMETMHKGMMQHMMKHMQMGKGSMAECPMMKGMMKKEGQSDMKKP